MMKYDVEANRGGFMSHTKPYMPMSDIKFENATLEITCMNSAYVWGNYRLHLINILLSSEDISKSDIKKRRRNALGARDSI